MDAETSDKADPKEQPGYDGTLRERECVERREELIDEALEETFPASDPPSIAKPDC